MHWPWKLQHTNLLILARKQPMKNLPLKIQTFFQRQILAFVHYLLRRLNRQPRHPRNSPRRVHRPFKARLRTIKGLSRKSPFRRLFPTEIHPRQYQLHSPTLPHRPDQPLRSARTRDNPKLDLRLPERCAGGAVYDISHHSKLTPPSKRHAVDSRDDRLADIRDGGGPGSDEIGVVGLAEGQVFHLFDVGTGGEGFFAAGEHDGAGGGVIVEGEEGGVELGEEGGGEGVEGAGAVEGYYMGLGSARSAMLVGARGRVF